jgi:hypothetical protein
MAARISTTKALLLLRPGPFHKYYLMMRSLMRAHERKQAGKPSRRIYFAVREHFCVCLLRVASIFSQHSSLRAVALSDDSWNGT